MQLEKLKDLFEDKTKKFPFHPNCLPKFRDIWRQLYEWLASKNISEFSVDDITDFCKCRFNTESASDIVFHSPDKTFFSGLSALKHLIRTGNWRQRILHPEYEFKGEMGQVFLDFLEEYKQMHMHGTVVSTTPYLSFFLIISRKTELT